MSFSQADIEMKIRRKMLQALNPAVVKRIAKGAEKLIYDLIIKRIYRGYNLEGEKFGRYNVGYNKGYAFRYVTGGINSPMASKYFRSPTEHASTSAPLRLSGQLLSNIKVQLLSTNVLTSIINVKYKISVPDEFKDQVIGLQSTTGTARDGSNYSKKAWTFLGLSKRLSEDVKVMEYFIKEIKGLTSSGASFNQKFK